jgi:hypothetical protein
LPTIGVKASFLLCDGLLRSPLPTCVALGISSPGDDDEVRVNPRAVQDIRNLVGLFVAEQLVKGDVLPLRDMRDVAGFTVTTFAFGLAVVLA